MIGNTKYVPEWYNPDVSYYLMQKYGDQSKEVRLYLRTGIFEL